MYSANSNEMLCLRHQIWIYTVLRFVLIVSNFSVMLGCIPVFLVEPVLWIDLKSGWRTQHSASNESQTSTSISCGGAQWLSGRGLDSRPRVRASLASLRCGPWARHIYPSLVLVQPRKTRPCLTERLLMGRKESNQANKINLLSSTLSKSNCTQQIYTVWKCIHWLVSSLNCNELFVPTAKILKTSMKICGCLSELLSCCNHGNVEPNMN